MITKPTALVLGAGASMTFDFPSGSGLAEEFVRLLAPGVSTSLRERLVAAYGANKVHAFHAEFAESAQDSIDSFLENRREFRDVGKGAIVAALLPREQQTTLFRQWNWYGYLLKRLGPRFEDFAENKLGVVTFNYDRTFEQFLFVAMQRRFGKSPEETANALKAIPLVHVYGSLGRLPHEGAEEAQTISFGTPTKSDIIHRGAEQIRIIDERSHTSAEFQKAHEILRRAERIIFLGFGYDATNIRRLVEYGPRKEQLYVGSGIGLTEAEASLAHEAFRRVCDFNTGPIIDSDERYPGDHDTLAYLRRHCWLG